MRSARVFGLLVVGLLTACGGVADTPDDAVDRGPIGKADLIGSCADQDDDDADHCGGKSEGNCWCDDLCTTFGDCCDDYQATCEDEVCDVQVVCALFCENGFKVDEDGCEICQCQGQTCAGIAALQCPEGQICVGVGDYPDAAGHCEPMPFIQCGGFGGFPCPDGLECVDVPNDGCDPQNGGADCGGMCVEPEPEPEGPSCEGHCGGKSGSCWCDDLCQGYGDCCDDYEAACEAPETSCGDDECGAGEVCVTHVTQTGLQHACAPVPDACDGVATCDCMGSQVCTGAFDLCSPSDDGLSCSCPAC